MSAAGQQQEALMTAITLSPIVIAALIARNQVADCATSSDPIRRRHRYEMTGLPPPPRALSVRKREFAPPKRR